MKRVIMTFASLIIFIIASMPVTTLAQEIAQAPIDTPVLTSISFKNASIDEEFSPYAYEYSLTLNDSNITPTLENYKIDGNANIFVTYNTDESNHQTGILVTLQFENGSTIYTFNYKNAMAYSQSSNNLLASVSCNLGEVYPEINDKDTEYKLYIPSDLTEINLTAATEEIGAYCEVPKTITLNTNQEPKIAINVIASNGETRTYNFKVKRLNKSCQEVRAEMASSNFISIIDGELFYQKPVFTITIFSVIGGAILLAIFIAIAKRLTIKVSDDDETEFFIVS